MRGGMRERGWEEVRRSEGKVKGVRGGERYERGQKG